MAFKYTVACGTLRFLGYDFLKRPQEILQVIKDAGYDGADLPGDPERMNAKELRRIVDSVGLEVPEVLGAWAYHHAGESRDLASPDEKVRKRGIQYAKKTIDLAVELGAQFFEICAAQPPVPQIPFPELPIETLRKNFLESVKEICEHGNNCGITVLLEPLNLYEAYAGVGTTIYEAINMIDKLGVSNVGIQPDVYHMNIGEASIPDALRAAGKYIKHFHMNETNHYRLGTGHADFKAIIRTLKEINFTGYIALYMPLVSQETLLHHKEDAPIGPDLKTFLEEPLKYLKKIENTVDLQRKIYEMDSS